MELLLAEVIGIVRSPDAAYVCTAAVGYGCTDSTNRGLYEVVYLFGEFLFFAIWILKA